MLKKSAAGDPPAKGGMIKRRVERVTMNTKKIILFCFLLYSLVVLSIFIFLTSRSFFYADDFVFIENTIQGNFSFFNVPYEKFYRPLSRELFFFISYQLFGLQPFGYFIINIFFHTAASALLFFLLLKIKLPNQLAALVSVLFFSNAAAFEKISWVSNFQHTSHHFFLVASALFAVLGMQPKGLKKYLMIVVSSLAWLCALLCNQAGIFFPIILFLVLISIYRGTSPRHGSKDILSAGIITLPHWIIFFSFLCIRQIWRCRPYQIDISTTTFMNNLIFYCQNALALNMNFLFIVFFIILVGLAMLGYYKKGLKIDFFKILIAVLISGFFYAPFAFLKLQRFTIYFSLPLIPIYVLIFSPFFKTDLMASIGIQRKKIFNVIIFALLVVSFLPNKDQLKMYFKNSPMLYTHAIWQQTKFILPEIPRDVTKIIFVCDKDISFFLWSIGGGRMMNILYNNSNLKCTARSETALCTTEPNAICIRVSMGANEFDLSTIILERI